MTLNNPDNKPIVLFDGVCNLCNGLVGFLISHDPHGHLRFAAMQSKAGQTLLRRHGLPLTDYQSFVLLDQNRVYLKSTGFLRLLGYLRRPWYWLRVLRFVPRSWRDWIYDLIARHRYRLFGQRPVCMTPSDDIAARFLAFPAAEKNNKTTINNG